MRSLLFLFCLLAMVAPSCIRCNKHIFKRATVIGISSQTEYLRTFLKSEQGITEEELENAKICCGCRSYIYGLVFRPEQVKSQGSKRALPDSGSAAEAAAAVVAKQLKEDEKYHSVSVRNNQGKY